MRVFSFFYRKGPLSSEIRGQQIGRALQARQNPTRDYADNICILVKVLPKLLRRDRQLEFNYNHTYLDLLDYSGGLPWVGSRPYIKVIAASRSSERCIREHCAKNPIVFIPQHHCNFERLRRPQRPVRTVSYIGLMPTPPPWYETVNAAVHKMGLEMRYFTEFCTRQEVVDAYLQTDIQFTWYDETMPDRWRQMKNALKVVNGASFGIPTVASYEPAYEAECAGWYRPSSTLADAMDGIWNTKFAMEQGLSFGRVGGSVDHLPDFAEPYHIDNIAQLYRRLAE